MKVKRFRLKEDVTKDDLMNLGFREGGTWIHKDAKLFLDKQFYLKDFEYSIGIAFSDNLSDWDDFDNVLVLDESFCQPYHPFYTVYDEEDVGKNIYVREVVRVYNDFMSNLGLFEEKVKEICYETYK